MKNIFENVTHITTQKEYDLLSLHLEELIKEAIKGGYLSDIEENDYTREIARLSILGGCYEKEFLTFSFSEPKISAQKKINRPVLFKNETDFVFAN